MSHFHFYQGKSNLKVYVLFVSNYQHYLVLLLLHHILLFDLLELFHYLFHNYNLSYMFLQSTEHISQYRLYMSIAIYFCHYLLWLRILHYYLSPILWRYH